MKKKISMVAIIIAVILSAFSAYSYATEIQPRTVISTDDVMQILEGEEVITSEEGATEDENAYEIIENDFFWFSEEDYTMNQLVDGNVYLFVDGDITFSGSIKGSAFVFATGTVEFTEECYIADVIYILADSVKVNGEVYDIYSAGNKFELGEYGYVNRDIRACASDIKLRGTIYRDVYLSAENINVKDEEAALLIGGDFNYSSSEEIEDLDEVVQYGNVNFSLQEEEDEEIVVEETITEKIADYAWGALSSVVYVLVIYGILKLIAPKFGEKTGNDLKEKGIVAFAVGLLVWVIIALAIIASIIMLFISVGAPVAVIAWIVMIVGIYISPAVFSIAIVNAFRKEKGNAGVEIAILAVIAAVVWLLQQVPLVGGFISFIVLTTGLGLVIRNSMAKRERKIEQVAEVVTQEVAEEVKKEVETTEIEENNTSNETNNDNNETNNDNTPEQ